MELPLNLFFGPLVSALAAGNSVILKPSEMMPAVSKVMADIIRDVFPENEVALFEGSLPTSQALLDMPFDHIFFTGSPLVGKIVMAAAAKHLTSVTLELGGKSPTIVDAAAFRQVVKEGGLRMNGMPQFGEFTDADLETIRFYLRARAQAYPAERAALLARKEAAGGGNAKAADFAGKWNVTIQSPVGATKAVMELVAEGDRLRGKVLYTLIPAHLIASPFTLSELQRAYEHILGHDLDKKAFRRRLENADVIEATGESRQDGAGRPAALYRLRPACGQFNFNRQLGA